LARDRLRIGKIRAIKKPTCVGFFIELVQLTLQRQQEQRRRQQQEQRRKQQLQQQEQQQEQRLFQQLFGRKRSGTEQTEQRSG